MKRLIYIILLLIVTVSVKGQVNLLSGNLQITGFPSSLPSSKFLVSGNFNDTKGLFYASDITTGMWMWKGNAYYVIDSIYSVAGTAIIFRVTDPNATGFISGGSAGIMELSVDGIPASPQTGDSNSSFMTPADYSAFQSYIASLIGAGGGVSLSTVNGIVSDSISSLKPCAIFYSNDGGTDLSNDSTAVYVDRCGEVSLFLNLTSGASSNLIANFNNPGDEDLGKTITITALDEDATWNIQVDGLFNQGENIISNYTLRNGEVIILSAQETDLGNRWVFTKWGTGVRVFSGVVADTATYTDADEGSILLIGSAPIDSFFVKDGDVWNLVIGGSGGGGVDLATVQAEISDSTYFFQTLTDFIAIAASTDFPLNKRIRIGDTGAEYLVGSSALSGYTTDSVAVIALAGGKYAQMAKTPRLAFEHFNIQSGDVSDSAGRENWRMFKKMLEYSRLQGIETISPLQSNKRYEMYLDTLTEYNPADGTVIKLDIDLNFDTLDFYPKSNYRTQNIIDISNTNANLKIQNGTIITVPRTLETYAVTIKPGGVLDRVVLPTTRRSAFTTGLVGQSVYVSPGYDLESDTVTVSAVLGDTLVFTRNITIGTSGSSGFIGKLWDQTLSADTLNTYGKWWSITNSGGFSFVYAISASTYTQNVEYVNVHSSGMTYFSNHSGGAGTVIFDKCRISALVTIQNMFNNNGVYKKLHAKNSEFYNTGVISYGQEPGTTAYQGDTWFAGTFYTHPNTHIIFENCRFDSCQAAIRQYSASGDKPLPDNRFQSSITNCDFKDTDDLYFIFTSQQLKTVISNCTFDRGAVWHRGHLEINNSSFKNTGLTVAYNGSTYPEDSIDFIQINGCVFDSLSSITGEHRINSRFIASNSTFRGSNTQTMHAVVADEMTYNNCDFIGGTFDMIASSASKANIRFNECTIDRPGILFYRNSSNSKMFFRDCEFTQIGNIVNDYQLSFASSTITLNKEAKIAPEAIDGIASMNWEFDNVSYGDSIITPVTKSYPINSRYTLPSASTFELDFSYNSFKLNGSASRLVFALGGTAVYRPRYGNIIITAVDSVVIPAYNPLTADSVSTLTESLRLAAGESAVLYFDNNTLKFSSNTVISATSDTLGTTSAGTLTYVEWEEFDPPVYGSTAGYRIVPGSVTITVGANVFYDNGNGILISATGSGDIDYLNNVVRLVFDSDPGVSSIVANYQFGAASTSIHCFGMFSPMRGNKVTGTPTHLPYFNAASQVATTSNLSWDYTNNTLGVGVASGTTARAVIRGTGATSSTLGLLVENSSGADMLRVSDAASPVTVTVGNSSAAADIILGGDANRDHRIGFGGIGGSQTRIGQKGSAGGNLFIGQSSGAIGGTTDASIITSGINPSFYGGGYNTLDSFGIFRGMTTTQFVPSNSKGTFVFYANMTPTYNGSGNNKDFASFAADSRIASTTLTDTVRGRHVGFLYRPKNLGGSDTLLNKATVIGFEYAPEFTSGLTDVYGLRINPTFATNNLRSFTGISLMNSNTNGYGIHQSGTAKNLFAGKFLIGSDSSFIHDPAADTTYLKGNLTVEGTTKLRENISTESTTDSTQAVLFQITLMNTTGGALAVKAPASPIAGDWFAVSDSRGQAGANNITVAFVAAVQNLHGSSQNYVLNANNGFAKFVYVDPTIGWIVAN